MWLFKYLDALKNPSITLVACILSLLDKTMHLPVITNRRFTQLQLFRQVSMCRLLQWSGQQQIFCNECKHWVHKKCSGLKRLTKDPNYRCTWCLGTAHSLDGRPQKEVQVGPDKLEVVAFFCYLGEMLSAAGGCELSTTTRVKTAWKKFKDLLLVLSSIMPPLFQNTWPCVQLLCVECNAPCQ